MPSQLSDDEITRLRVAVARIARQVDRQVTGDGMTPTQMSVLSSVVRNGPIAVTELADTEGINPTMLSRVLGKLEVAELVTRTPDPDDRRVLRVAATKHGSALQLKLRKQRAALFARRLAELPDGHTEVLLQALPALESLATLMMPAALGRVSR